MNAVPTFRRLPLAAALLALPMLAQAQSLTATGAATPSTNLNPGDWVLVTVNTTKAGNPTSTGITVQADLSGFLRSTAQDLNDAGQYGDAVAGDGVFTYRENIASAATLASGWGASSCHAAMPLVVRATSRSSRGAIASTVGPAPSATRVRASSTPLVA